MRDHAAVCNRGRACRREYYPVRLLRVVWARGQFGAFTGWHPRVGAVSEHRILPNGHAGAVGEADGFIVFENVGVVARAWRDLSG